MLPECKSSANILTSCVKVPLADLPLVNAKLHTKSSLGSILNGSATVSINALFSFKRSFW